MKPAHPCSELNSSNIHGYIATNYPYSLGTSWVRCFSLASTHKSLWTQDQINWCFISLIVGCKCCSISCCCLQNHRTTTTWETRPWRKTKTLSINNQLRTHTDQLWSLYRNICWGCPSDITTTTCALQRKDGSRKQYFLFTSITNGKKNKKLDKEWYKSNVHAA